MIGKTTIVQNLRLVKKTCNADFDDALSKNGMFASTLKSCGKIEEKKPK